MTLSAINPAAHAASLPEVQTATPAPASSKSSPAPAPTDTVTLSPAAQKASQAGDIDHDGDSH
jgi:hypothetical protein